MDNVEVLKAFAQTLDRQLAKIPVDESPHASDATRRKLSFAYLRLAKDLSELDAGDESFAAGRKAVLADPDNLDAAFFHLAWLEKLNRIDEAWAELRAIEGRHPAPYAACSKLYHIKACLEYRRGHLETARAMFEAFIEKNHGRQLATLAYGWLGKTLDRLGLYDGAMEAVTRYNSLVTAYPEAQDMLQKGNARLANIETSLCWYRNKSSFEWQETGIGEGDASPIVLVGFPRSGTTLLEQILHSHSTLRAVDERQTLEGIEERFFGSEEKLSHLQHLNAGDARACRQAYWANVARFVGDVHGDNMRVVDKYPLNIVHLDIYARLFPKVRIIVALRDPRDSVLSNYFQTFTLNHAMVANLNLSASAQHYAKVMELYQLFRNFMPDNIHEVRYENIVGDFKGECTRLLDFLGLEWEDSLERFHETAAQRWIRTPSYEQVTRPIYGDAMGRWKNYARHLEEINPILQPFVEAFGYQP